jgi:hypothetical protein
VKELQEFWTSGFLGILWNLYGCSCIYVDSLFVSREVAQKSERLTMPLDPAQLVRLEQQLRWHASALTDQFHDRFGMEQRILKPNHQARKVGVEILVVEVVLNIHNRRMEGSDISGQHKAPQLVPCAFTAFHHRPLPSATSGTVCMFPNPRQSGLPQRHLPRAARSVESRIPPARYHPF